MSVKHAKELAAQQLK
jgi:hypothetical protein